MRRPYRRPQVHATALVAALGADPYAPMPGVEIADIFHYYDGPLSGLMVAEDGRRWLFECLYFDSGPRRVWRYVPLEPGTATEAALATYDRMCEGGEAPAVAPATMAVSDDQILVAAFATGALADAADTARRLALQLSADGCADVDRDIYVVSLRQAGADDHVVAAARAAVTVENHVVAPADAADAAPRP
jgi:hypothetical protein